MAKTLTVRVDEATYKLIAAALQADNRSISKFVETAARQKAAAEILVSESEMGEIRADRRLVRRLQRGHREAVSRRGVNR